jgi:hypothetical protein
MARFGLTVLGAAGKPTYARGSGGDVHFNVFSQKADWKDFVRNHELHKGMHSIFQSSFILNYLCGALLLGYGFTTIM